METENVAPESDSEQSEAHSQQDRHRSRTKAPKNRKRRSSKPPPDDSSDSEDSRHPLGDTFYRNKQSQRANQHPNMPAKTRKQNKAEKEAKAKRARDPEENELGGSGDESEAQVPETIAKRQKKQEDKAKIRNLQLELARYKARENAESKVANRPRPKGKQKVKGSHSAMQAMVEKTTKTDFFKVAKFVSDEKQVEVATRKVMKFLDLDELRGLEGDDLIQAEEDWIATWKDTVRMTLNNWRNYTAGELQKLLKDIMVQTPERMTYVPNPEQLLKVIMREGLVKTPGMSNEEAKAVELAQTHFDFYWDCMASKVAGHKAWGAGKRHHGLMSTMRKSPNSELCVTPSDEAFLLLVWENNFDRWKWQHEQDELQKQLDAEKAERKREAAKKKAEGGESVAAGNKKVSADEDEDDEDDDDSDEEESDEEGSSKKKKGKGKKKKGKKKKGDGEEEEPVDPKSISPYTIKDGGALPYGGWNKKGRKRYRDLLKMIDASKKKKHVIEADTAALLRIREYHKVDKRAAKAKKGKQVEEAEEIDSDHEPDWY